METVDLEQISSSFMSKFYLSDALFLISWTPRSERNFYGFHLGA